MAFSSFIRKATPVITCTLRTQNRNYTSAIFNFTSTTLTKSATTNLTRQGIVATGLKGSYGFSSMTERTNSEAEVVGEEKEVDVDDGNGNEKELLSVLDEEIKLHIASVNNPEEPKLEGVPKGFVFEIEDKSGNQFVVLKRKYQGEDISVEVHPPPIITGEDAEEEEDTTQRLPINVHVSKNSGLQLEFQVIAYPDEIQIDYLTVKDPKAPADEITYDGPEFQDLDENLQKAFIKYLAMRGVNPATTNFMLQYMVEKDDREYLGWLKKMKQFFAK